MSWQDYVDNQLIASQCVSKACIAGHDGGVWAKSEGFEVSKRREIVEFRNFFPSPEKEKKSSRNFRRRISYFSLWPFNIASRCCTNCNSGSPAKLQTASMTFDLSPRFFIRPTIWVCLWFFQWILCVSFDSRDVLVLPDAFAIHHWTEEMLILSTSIVKLVFSFLDPWTRTFRTTISACDSADGAICCMSQQPRSI